MTDGSPPPTAVAAAGGPASSAGVSAPVSSRGGSSRLDFLDAVRGAAVVSMVVNHTARFWMSGPMTWPRYHLIYVTLTLAAPLFLFLVGFFLPFSLAKRVAAGGGWALAGKYLRRGGEVIAVGYALNLVVFPEEPPWVGGVLLIIGLSILLLAPVAYLAASTVVRGAALAAAAAMYVAFSLSHARVAEWVAAHPLAGQLWFYDFAVWPWLALPLVGVVLGAAWSERARRSPREQSRYFALLGAAAVACVLLFLAIDWWLETPVRFGLKRDFILNRHWIPRGVALLWVFGTIFGYLALAYYLMAVRGLRFPWLVTLGQAAFMLYFSHQVIVVTIVQRFLGVTFQQWWAFWLANGLLIVLLVYMGRGWLELKRRVRARWNPRDTPRGPAGAAAASPRVT